MASVLLLGVGALSACDSAEDRAESHYQSGMELLAEDNPVKAQLEFRNALQLDKNHVGALIELARMAMDEQELARALRLYNRVVDIDETNVEAHVNVGRVMLAANRIDDALESSITAFQLAPKDPEVLTLKASTALKLENFESAAQTIEEGLTLDPGNPDLYILKVALFRNQDDEEGALAVADEGLTHQPDNVALQVLRIDTLGRLGRRQEVTDALAQLIEKRPDEPAFREAQVRWLISQRDFEGAEAGLRALAEIEPGEPQRNLDIVRFILRTKGTEAAMEELDGMIADAGNPSEAWPFNAAKIEYFIRLGRIAEAETMLSESIERLGEAETGNDARLQLARLRIAQRDMDSAKRLVAEVIERDAENPGALTLRGRLSIIDEDYDSAIGDLRKALDLSPDYVEALHMLALAHERNGSRQLSGQRLADAVEVSDRAPRSSILYAQFLLEEDKIEAAENVLAQSLDKHPLDKELLQALARVRLAQQDWVGAEEVADRLRDIDAEGTLDDRIRAASLLGQDRVDEGLDVLRGTTESGTATTNDLAALVGSYVRTGKLDEASAFLDTALIQNPDNPEVLRLKGIVAEAGDDPDAAERHYQAAIAAAPGEPRAHAALTRFLVAQDRAEEAEDAVRRGIDVTGNNGLRMTLAGLLERRGDIEGAIEQYETIYESSPGSDVVANNLASLMTDNNPTPEEIERAYNIAKRLRDSDVPHYQDTYGWLLFKRGDARRALASINKAAEALPDNPVVRYHLGAVLAELGEADKARRELEVAIELAAGRPLPQIDRARQILAELDRPEQPEATEAAQ